MSRWEMVRLGDVATYINGFAFKPSDWGTKGLPIIRIQDLTGNSYEKNYYSGEYNEKYEINDGDVLISWSASLGVYQWGNGKALLNQHIFKVDFNKINIDKKYFSYSVKKRLTSVENQVHGSTMKHITKGRFDDLQIPLPPLEVQKNIANELDAISALIEKRKEQIERLDILVKAKFVEMFGDPVVNPMGWEKTTLAETTTIITGNTPPRNNKENYGDYIEWVKTDNITSNRFLTKAVESLSEKGAKIGRVAPKNSILMACIAGSIKSIGRVAIAKDDVAFNQQINAIIPEKYDLLFLYILLKFNAKYIQSTINMSLKGILSKGKLESLSFVLPPINLQNDFAGYVEKVEKTKDGMAMGLEKLELLYKERMQEYFG